MTLTVSIMVEHNSVIFDLVFTLMLFPLYLIAISLRSPSLSHRHPPLYPIAISLRSSFSLKLLTQLFINCPLNRPQPSIYRPNPHIKRHAHYLRLNLLHALRNFRYT